MIAPAATATVRWGILGAGWISHRFSLDLLVSPATREVTDVAHVIGALGCRSKEKGRNFLKELYTESGLPVDPNVKIYESYKDLYADPSIDVIYVGLPHSHHYSNVLEALKAGKNVLCEKPVTVNSKQAQVLIDTAKEKNVFFMEAVWTRFTPIAYKVQELIESGVIGDIQNVQAELSIQWQPEKKDASHRMVAPELAGGALLDLGPYPWTWLALTLLQRPSSPTATIPVPSLVASITKTDTGVDSSTRAILQFPQQDGRILLGTFAAGLTYLTSPSRSILIQGSKGFLELEGPAFRPTGIRLTAWASGDSAEEALDNTAEKPSKTETFSFEPRPGNVWGFAWEADEVARCIRDGKKESARMPHRETMLMMQVFDEIRRQGGLAHPESIEAL